MRSAADAAEADRINSDLDLLARRSEIACRPSREFPVTPARTMRARLRAEFGKRPTAEIIGRRFLMASRWPPLARWLWPRRIQIQFGREPAKHGRFETAT